MSVWSSAGGTSGFGNSLIMAFQPEALKHDADVQYERSRYREVPNVCVVLS